MRRGEAWVCAGEGVIMWNTPHGWDGMGWGLDLIYVSKTEKYGNDQCVCMEKASISDILIFPHICIYPSI